MKLNLREFDPGDLDEWYPLEEPEEPQNLLEAFELIVRMAKKSRFTDTFFGMASSTIEYVQSIIGFSPEQIALLAVFLNRSDDQQIQLCELGQFLGCSTLKMLQMENEIDVLVEKRYIRSHETPRGRCFRIPREVIDCLRHNEPYEYERAKICDIHGFLDRINGLVDERHREEITYRELVTEASDMLEDIKDSDFVKGLREFGLHPDHANMDDLFVFIFMAHAHFFRYDDDVALRDMEGFFDNGRVPGRLRYELQSRNSVLFKNGVIENRCDDGFLRPGVFCLTEKALNDILGELQVKKGKETDRNLIKTDSLVRKELFYNESEGRQIADIESLLSAERFAQIQSRLRGKGMRPGVCCLFYGAPGTGKTETVYQLALRTGRDIMRVDVDKIRDKYVGESEKKIKQFFDRYRNLCLNSELAPILLFNEADAILGVRMENATRSVDKMENSVQNIILQEMETLPGIMIATTNLTSNLDKAFERRFLYKVQFGAPTQQARAMIWQSMLAGLTGEQATTLAARFNLSGGEIENVTRKFNVYSILNGDDAIDLDKIIEICQEERIAKKESVKIGF